MAVERDPARSRAMTAAQQQLESLRTAGVSSLARPGRNASRRASKAAAIETARTEARDESPTLAKFETNAAAVSAKLAAASKPTQLLPNDLPAPARTTDSLEIVQREVAACRACKELADTRTQTVFGVGNPNARLVFLGEAPGADEDKQGEPFVGRAGQLLTKIIEACTLSRSDVYILNVLKCRPPGNRNPQPDEVANCRGFLDRQLALIQPEYICCLGAVAARTLLDTEQPIGKLRGRFIDYNGISVMCTYHPAYLLRNPEAKKFVWEDMKVLMRRIGIELG